MKLLPLLLPIAFAMAGLPSLPAQEEMVSAEGSVSVTATPAYVSQYLFRGRRLGGQAFQPTLEADRGGWALGLWGNFPIQGKVPGQSDPELDLYGSYTREVTSQLSFAPGFTLYSYPRASAAGGFYRATFEPSLAANVTVAGIRFSPKLYYDVVLQGPTGELSAISALPLKSLGTEVDFSAIAGSYFERNAVHGASPGTKGWGSYWLVGVTVPFAIGPKARISVGWAYTEGAGLRLKRGSRPAVGDPLQASRGVVTVSCSKTF